MPEPSQSPDDSQDPRVAESFNIYQATMAMLSIFTGFVFAALLQILLAPEQLDFLRRIGIDILIAALIGFLLAIFSFHHAAHRMVRYWKIPLPLKCFRENRGCRPDGWLYVHAIWSIGSLMSQSNDH